MIRLISSIAIKKCRSTISIIRDQARVISVQGSICTIDISISSALTCVVMVLKIKKKNEIDFAYLISSGLLIIFTPFNFEEDNQKQKRVYVREKMLNCIFSSDGILFASQSEAKLIDKQAKPLFLLFFF